MMLRFFGKPLFIGFFLFLVPAPLFASHPETIRIDIPELKTGFDFSTSNTAGGVSLAVADLGEDGVPEIMIGNGLGSEPRVSVLRQDGSEIGSFLAYAQNMGSGIHVIVCDLTGDGVNEIVTSAARGGGPHIRVFSNEGQAMDQNGFFAYDASFRGGVNLACGNLDDDRKAELVTLPEAGGGPHVRVWKWKQEHITLQQEFFVFDASDRSGLVGVIAKQELVIAQQFTSEPVLKKIVIHNQPRVVSEKKISTTANGMVSLVLHDEELYLITTNGALIHTETEESVSFASASKIFTAVSADVNEDNTEDWILAPARDAFRSKNVSKEIVVDLSEQRLFAYSNGILDNTFLISSGTFDRTPIGNHSILAKIPFVHYAWFYGENSPWNYDLGLVPYNLRFAPHLYLHYAYWHNNFGHPMSRGCVNINLENMKWLYDWGMVGDVVVIEE